MEEPRNRRRRPLTIVLAIALVAALLIFGLAAWWVGRGDEVLLYPDVDPPPVEWSHDPSTPGDITRDAGPGIGLTFRVRPSLIDSRADRVYVTLRSRILGLDARDGSVVWWAPATDTSTPPVAVNFGAFDQGDPDFEVYAGTDDGLVIWHNDTAGVPTSGALTVGGNVTAVAAFTADT